MENASKALLIAAGIFFSMLILTMIMYMSGKITEIGEVQESKRAAEQLAAFNEEYEAYNKKLMYGTDVITVINKAREDGISIKVTDKSGNIYDEESEFNNLKSMISANIRDSQLSDEEKEEISYEGLKIFECVSNSTRYNVTTGKVEYMEFKEIEI